MNQPCWFVFAFFVAGILSAQEAGGPPARGSIVEDRAAKKLLDAGDARLEADETEKAQEIWRSVIERYPRSKMRFDAHLRLGDYLLEKKRAFDEARGHFESVDVDANTDEAQRAEAALKTGVCFYEGRLYGQCFKILRRVIEDYPQSEQVNSAYYYIGLGHFKQGHYSRAIEALEKVGTALSEDDAQVDKVEAGKRLFVKVTDQDLAVLEPGETITVRCKAKSGDEELVVCHPIGRQVRVVLGSVATALGSPVPGNGRLEVHGGDVIDVHYVDAQTADKKFDQPRLYAVNVVGTAIAEIKDGSFGDTLAGVVIGKEANLEVVDADFDKTDNADKLTAIAEIWREKSTEEIDEEIAALAAKRDPLAEEKADAGEETEELKVERYKKIDEVRVALTEADIPLEAVEAPEVEEEGGEATEGEVAGTEAPAPVEAKEAPNAETEDPVDPAAAAEPGAETPAAPAHVGVHSGIFRGRVAIENASEPKAGDNILQGQPGDKLRLRYRDNVNLTRTAIDLTAEARCIEGNLGNVRVTKTDISDAELKIKTKLRAADALTNIGNHYKEFG
ncbi:MAG: tetratricopeptide repeat protein, partial [Verrucomicrobiales bacterium]|nr:tetratricopeptide repeat protein [Verrucomicrobiales bacterium]